MPLGVLVDCAAVGIGSLLGCAFGRALPQRTRELLNVIFGFCAMAIGVNSIIRVSAMAPVILSVVLGCMFGDLLDMETGLKRLAGRMVALLPAREGFDMDRFVTVIVLFCASGFGIYGVLLSGMSGNHSVLLSKSVLDCATAAVFAVALGPAVAAVCLPMAAVMLSLFAASGLLAPVVTETMLRDFMACGGVLTLVTGFRVAGIKNTPITNMIPALILVMPLSALYALLPL